MREQSELFARINRPRRLPDEIALSISAAIEEGQLGPGDRLPTELALSGQFGVARTVVREAISLLKYDGIIQSRQGVGAFVAGPGERTAFRISPACFAKRKQLVQLLQLRTGVQADASALAATARSDDQLAEIEAFLNDMMSAVSQGSRAAERRVDAEFAFYRAITKASGNPCYVEFIGMIETRILQNLHSVVVKNAVASEWGTSILSEHRGVFDAIEAGNAKAARTATRLHFEQAANRLADRADLADN